MKKFWEQIKNKAIWLLKAEPFSGIFILLIFFGIISYPYESQKMILGCMTVCFASIFAYVSNYQSRRQLKFELFKRRMLIADKISDGYNSINNYMSHFKLEKKGELSSDELRGISFKTIEEWQKNAVDHKANAELSCVFKKSYHSEYIDFINFINLGTSILETILETKSEEEVDRISKDFAESYNKLLGSIIEESRLF